MYIDVNDITTPYVVELKNMADGEIEN